MEAATQTPSHSHSFKSESPTQISLARVEHPTTLARPPLRDDGSCLNPHAASTVNQLHTQNLIELTRTRVIELEAERCSLDSL